MPKLQDIEQFKASLKNLGRETEILSRWGESWQDMAAPPQGIPDDIASLLESGPGDEIGGAPGVSSIDDDFASFLDDMTLGGGTTAPETPPAADDFEVPGAFLEGADESAEDEFAVPASLLEDFESLSEPEQEAETGTEPYAEAEPKTEPEPETEAEFEEATDEFGDLDELEPLDTVESAESAKPMESVPGMESIQDGEPIPEIDDFVDAEPVSDEEPVIQTEPSLDAETIEDFSVPESLLGDLDELDALPGEEPTDTGGAAPETSDIPEITEETFGLDDLEAFSEEPSGAATADDFSLPGLDGFDAAPDSGAVEESAESAEAPDEVPEEVSEPQATQEPGFEIGTESMEGDAFDQFDLGGSSSDFAVPDIPADDFSKSLGLDDIDGQMASLDGESSAADNFSLDAGWGGDFTIPGFEMGGESAAPAPKKGAKPAAAGQLADAFGAEPSKVRQERQVRPVELTDEQADALQDTLLAYPLNLRLAVEDVIANGKGSEVQQSDLIWMLVEGAPAKDAAKLAGRILKRYIEIPTGFAKRTGAAFEAEKGSFRYIFVHSILPVLQMLTLVAAAAGAIFYLGYTFAYKPLKANSLYAEGLRQIGLSKYGESMEFFDRADREWSMKGWHYRYAEAYSEDGQYPRAEAMYDRLLQRWPKETQAALDYAQMEMDTLDFPKAEAVLQNYILERDYFNKQALTMSAENFIAWADFEEQRYEGPDARVIENLHEKARLQLATLMERHGRSDAYLELMLLYLLRAERFGGADKLKEILPLSSYLVDNAKSGWSASTMAELGEYLLDREETENVNAISLRAIDQDGASPEAHLLMARWNKRSGFKADELKAMEYAARFFAEEDARTGLSTKRNKRYMESLIRLGELRRADGNSLDAEDAFNTAIERYERALAGRQLKRTPVFGKAYARLADIYYAERMDFQGALALYSEAERNGFVTPETDYRRGYIHYMQPGDDGSAALGLFYRAALDTEPSPYLQWATANALYTRSDYFAAQGYYATLANRLQFELDTIALPSPQAKPSHAELVELLMMTRNNLGVSLYRVAERMGDARRRADAMVEFTESARLFDSISRDQKTMLRPDSKNLGFLNLDFVLHPMRGIDLGLYKTIPTDMEYPRK